MWKIFLIRGRGVSVGTSRLGFYPCTQKVEGSFPDPLVLFRKIFIKINFPVHHAHHHGIVFPSRLNLIKLGFWPNKQNFAIETHFKNIL